jgi:hypothetical protein
LVLAWKIATAMRSMIGAADPARVCARRVGG